ncbi:MAG: LD-carboxypeptidase [Rickettsiaceae bacterium]|nr:LD-carboxypeptidase [Rickettsiaceae bacterium]
MKFNIKIVAPASRAGEDLDTFLEQLNRYGVQEKFEFFISKDIFNNPELPFFSASEEIRIADMIDAITSTKYDIIWPVRGGYGAAEIARKLLKLNITTTKPKILIGFSDITALHILFNQHYNIPTIHGPMVEICLKNDISFSVFCPILSGEKVRYKLYKINGAEVKTDESKINGGNLTVLQSLIGTDLQPKFQGKILLLEDVNEAPYRVHRMLEHIKEAGILNGVFAIIFADFVHQDKDLMQKTIFHFANNQVGDIPCFIVENIGHGSENNPIAFETHALIGLDSQGAHYNLDVWLDFSSSI